MKKLNIKGEEFEMQKIELKKIESKIELDTKVEACWNDCHTGNYWYEGYSSVVYAQYGWCVRNEVMTPKTCRFW